VVAALQAIGVSWSTIGTVKAVAASDEEKTVGSTDEGPASRGGSEDVGTESETEKTGTGVEGNTGMLTCVPVREARDSE